MKLRIARKMDTGGVGTQRIRSGDKRDMWRVYTPAQLARAERRLRRSWATHREPGDEPRTYKLTPDWFAANRVHARLTRQCSLARLLREQRERPGG